MASSRIRQSAGRPTKYRPEYCDIVESLGAKGKSPTEIASILNVDRASLYRWAAAHEDFALSLARAKTFEQGWWEEVGRTSLNEKHFPAALWWASMRARFKDDYTVRSARPGSLDLGKVLKKAVKHK